MKPSTPPLSIAHPRRGWAFWWRWVLATNLGWFPGIALGTWLAQPIAEGTPHLAAVATASVTALTTTAVAARTRVPSPVLEDWLDIGCYSSVPGPSQGVKSW